MKVICHDIASNADGFACLGGPILRAAAIYLHRPYELATADGNSAATKRQHSVHGAKQMRGYGLFFRLHHDAASHDRSQTRTNLAHGEPLRPECRREAGKQSASESYLVVEESAVEKLNPAYFAPTQLFHVIIDSEASAADAPCDRVHLRLTFQNRAENVSPATALRTQPSGQKPERRA